MYHNKIKENLKKTTITSTSSKCKLNNKRQQEQNRTLTNDIQIERNQVSLNDTFTRYFIDKSINQSRMECISWFLDYFERTDTGTNTHPHTHSIDSEYI